MKKLLFCILILLLSCAHFFTMTEFEKTSRVLLLPQNRNNVEIDVRLADGNLFYENGDSSPIIKFSANQDLYMFVFHVNAEGQMLLLWPDAYDDPGLDNFVRKGVVVEIPSLYTFFGDYYGREYIQAFGFQKMNSDLESAKQLFAKKALEGKYLEHNPFRDMHNMKNLARKTDKNWNADMACFYFNVRPFIFDVALSIDTDYLPCYIDGELITRSDCQIKVTEGEHILSHYQNGTLLNESLFIHPDQRTCRIGTEEVFQPTAAENPSRVFVFAMGIGDYQDSAVSNLRRTPKDAQDFVNTVKAVYGDQAEVDFKLLTESNATKHNIEAFLSEGIHSHIDKNTDVFVYFSGHGTQVDDQNNDEADGRDEALVPYDFSMLQFTDSVLLDDDLYEYYKAIGNNSQKAFIIIDACFSGGSKKGIKSVQPDSSMKSGFTVNRDSMESEMNDKGENFIFFSASQGDEQAMEDPESNLENSLFTYYLLRGISGEADMNGNGFINAEEIYTFTGQKIKEWFNERDWYSEEEHEPLFNNPGNIEFAIPVR